MSVKDNFFFFFTASHFSKRSLPARGCCRRRCLLLVATCCNRSQARCCCPTKSDDPNERRLLNSNASAPTPPRLKHELLNNTLPSASATKLGTAPSVRPSVRPSVHPSSYSSSHPSIHPPPRSLLSIGRSHRCSLHTSGLAHWQAQACALQRVLFQLSGKTCPDHCCPVAECAVRFAFCRFSCARVRSFVCVCVVECTHNRTGRTRSRNNRCDSSSLFLLLLFFFFCFFLMIVCFSLFTSRRFSFTPLSCRSILPRNSCVNQTNLTSENRIVSFPD